jgi:isocitrate dehydrogenase kinase/phosphatase
MIRNSEAAGETARSAGPDALAELVAAAYERYRARFQAITRRAAQRFGERNWISLRQDALNRLLLYGHAVDRAVEQLSAALGPSPPRAAGAALKASHARWCAGRDDAELTQTFYNSVVRRVFRVRGVEPALEYCGDELDHGDTVGIDVARTIAAQAGELPLDRVLRSLPLHAPLAHPARDAERISAAVRRELERVGARAASLDLLDPVFYRNRGAYVIGRIVPERGDPIPLVLALRHHDRHGAEVDAALFTSDEASIVFGFTRSYFHVDVGKPRATADFLRAIMPQKRLDELYTAIGHHRHGKAELYRALMTHLQEEGGRFEPAPGEPGLVMTVFTLPSFNVVFKVIRDRFGAPKRTTAREVRERYEFVFRQDRVGRLADAQEFEQVQFRRAAFSDEVLDELLREAGSTVRALDGTVHVDHLYTERRVRPLNLYLRESDTAAATAALLDYGNAIRQLAAANIFPGDMLFKNFGVTRHGRVIFYDYDEVAYLTECNIRRLPEPRTDEEELAGEPWFHVGENDVFPEEFARFMTLPGPAGAAFLEAHAELFTVAFWRAMQEAQREGEIMEFFPYPDSRRLARRP